MLFTLDANTFWLLFAVSALLAGVAYAAVMWSNQIMATAVHGADAVSQELQDALYDVADRSDRFHRLSWILAVLMIPIATLAFSTRGEAGYAGELLMLSNAVATGLIVLVLSHGNLKTDFRRVAKVSVRQAFLNTGRHQVL